jgi:hypothetical protein
MTPGVTNPNVRHPNELGRPVLANPVWNKLSFPMTSLQPDNGFPPAWGQTFGLNAESWHFSWNAANAPTMQFQVEMPADWLPGGLIYPFVRVGLPAAGGGGPGAENIQFSMQAGVADEGGAFGAGLGTFNSDTIDVKDGVIREHVIITWPSIDMSGYIQNVVFLGFVQRLQAIGNDYQQSIPGFTFGFWYLKDKMGTNARSAPLGD